jgi:hypothetical protein
LGTIVYDKYFSSEILKGINLASILIGTIIFTMILGKFIKASRVKV